MRNTISKFFRPKDLKPNISQDEIDKATKEYLESGKEITKLKTMVKESKNNDFAQRFRCRDISGFEGSLWKND
jgi:uncharacterized protein (DUF2249 family)